jgi:lipoprotein-releasing system ATP-binding protein
MIANGSFLLTKRLKNQAREVLDMVGLSHRLSHRPNELSGGEQQRVALARAIINKPRLLLADEPTGNLDTANSEKIWFLFKKLRDEQKQTIVIVTHNNEIAKLADRNIQMVDGRIQQ